MRKEQKIREMIESIRSFRELQDELYQKALIFQQKFDAGKFGMVSQNYPSMQQVEGPDFKLINNLVSDLRGLDQIKSLNLESHQSFSFER